VRYKILEVKRGPYPDQLGVREWDDVDSALAEATRRAKDWGGQYDVVIISYEAQAYSCVGGVMTYKKGQKEGTLLPKEVKE